MREACYRWGWIVRKDNIKQVQVLINTKKKQKEKEFTTKAVAWVVRVLSIVQECMVSNLDVHEYFSTILVSRLSCDIIENDQLKCLLEGKYRIPKFQLNIDDK